MSAALGAEGDISVGKLTASAKPPLTPLRASYVLLFLCSILMRLLHTGGGGTTLRTPVYNLFPLDLRMSPAASLAPLLTTGHHGEPMLSSKLPTLLLFECVLAYMDPAASKALIRWFVDYFAAAAGGLLGGVVYEMFKLNDAFGRVMLNNLKVRNDISSPGCVCSRRIFIFILCYPVLT